MVEVTHICLVHTPTDNSFGNSFTFTENNILGTHVLLEAAKELVFSKSMKVQEFKEQLSAMCDPPMPEDNIALSTLGCCCCRCEGEGFGDSCCTACVCCNGFSQVVWLQHQGAERHGQD